MLGEAGMHSRREQLCTTPVVWMVVCPCFKLNTDDFDNRAFREVGSETEIQSRNRRNYRHSSPFIAASNTPAEHRRSKSYSIQSPTRLAMGVQLAVCVRERGSVLSICWWPNGYMDALPSAQRADTSFKFVLAF